VGLVGIVEMVYRLSEQGASTVLTVLGLSFDAQSAPPWIGFGLVLAASLPFPAAAMGLADGEALIFGPDGKGGAVVVARLKIEEWAKLGN